MCQILILLEIDVVRQTDFPAWLRQHSLKSDASFNWNKTLSYPRQRITQIT
ncbi:hypothetical protein C427_3140 [Paraglaciecola psychrophila 170]|uniref:Uncharacterized protein n=1 Tax=Paraglaciecola psychrophila 170 TaxID=1129794 RepID=K7AB54_9ALTE|nr:hypothetical protein C427_3140 [Paraglaciecola psychrophila 170]GAC39517.1 hypothetical protein GPSY_3906 [Paraglaciecola psychrophila 170]